MQTKKKKDIPQYSPFQSRDTSPGPQEYEVGVAITQSSLSLRGLIIQACRPLRAVNHHSMVTLVLLSGADVS
jgi:hypothetical protein